MEIFGREADSSRLPTEVVDGVFVAFAVDDIAGAREEFATADVELIGDLVWAAEGYRVVLLPGSRQQHLRDAAGHPLIQSLTAPITTTASAQRARRASGNVP